ncbi:GNAT family N-acetyltransferase [Corynebacterium choanae]|uniref:Succinyl-CoA transferase n=1 Tax=Corynebacterium choanae TaxID=1862358 RepID=A0A3G6J934_9CORY|nr:GNAT family protein [Corynebacterium choanae]AZA14577.1 Putative succinyl-CoA transferase [Corynebacterium choanae]
MEPTIAPLCAGSDLQEALRTVVITDGEISLTSCRPEDADDYVAFMEDLQLFVGNEQAPFFFPWYRQHLRDPQAGAHASWDRLQEKVAAITAERCDIPLLVRRGTTIVGQQDLRAVDFVQHRVISTGSLLDQRYQGAGIGKRMRRMLLAFAFDYLGATLAITGAHPENASSIAVSKACGYQPIAVADVPTNLETVDSTALWLACAPDTFQRADTRIRVHYRH